MRALNGKFTLSHLAVELQNFIKKKMQNPQIAKDAFLVYMIGKGLLP